MRNLKDLDIDEVKQKILELPDDATVQDVMSIFGMGNTFEFNRQDNQEPPFENMPNEGGRGFNNDNVPNDFDKRDNMPIGGGNFPKMDNKEIDISKLKEIVENIDSNTTLGELIELLGIDRNFNPNR